MKPDPANDFEKDPVWALLRESSALRPGPNFASNVVRAARLEGQDQAQPWWKRLIIPGSVGVALAGATALVMAVISLQTGPVSGPGTGDSQEHDLASLQDTVETEVLMAASERLGDYSDQELASMVGF